MISAHRQDDGVIMDGEIIEKFNPLWAEEAKNLGVLAVPFENRIPEGKPIGIVANVVGRIVFRSFEKGVSKEINRVAWLSEADHRMYFAQGDSHKLIILTFGGRSDDPRVSIARRDLASAARGIQTDWLTLISDGVFSVTVSLINEISGGVLRKVDYILELTFTPFAVTLTRASPWKREHILEYLVRGRKFSRRLHQIFMETQEKGKAIGNFSDDETLAMERQQEAGVADEAKVWENEAANFIGLYISVGEKDKFLNSKPSIDRGAQRASKNAFERMGPPVRRKEGEPFEARLSDPYWTLSDSIDVRLERLESILNSIGL